MIVQTVTTSCTTTQVILGATRDACMSEVEEIKAKFPPAGYGTKIEAEGIDHGFLGDGYYIVVVRGNTC